MSPLADHARDRTSAISSELRREKLRAVLGQVDRRLMGLDSFDVVRTMKAHKSEIWPPFRVRAACLSVPENLYGHQVVVRDPESRRMSHRETKPKLRRVFS